MSYRRYLLLSVLVVLIVLPLCLTGLKKSVSAQDESVDSEGGPSSTEIEQQEPYLVSNVAASGNGSTVSVSSTYGMNFPASSAIDGDRKGVGWGSGTGGWADSSQNEYSSDWVEVNFAGSRTINRIDVITLRDGYATKTYPVSLAESFNLANNTGYGITYYDVQYWNGSAWVTVNGGAVQANSSVWRQFIFSPVITNKIRVAVHGSVVWTTAANNYSRIVEIEAYAGGVNVAREAGAWARASSQYNANFPASAVINGERDGRNWGTGGGWADATENQYSVDWMRVDFNELKTISEIDVITLQDDYANPVEPTLGLTFSMWGIVDFDVQYLDRTNGAWRNVSGGRIRGNNNVLRQLKFENINTEAIRVVVHKGAYPHPVNYSRIVELEAYGRPAYVVMPDPDATESSSGICGKLGADRTKMDPCELSRNLLSAMQGNRTGELPYSVAAGNRSRNWPSELDWNYNKWRNYSTQNRPVLAHALALWRESAEYQGTFPDNFPRTDAAINWWFKYLDCQTREAPCTVANPVMLKFWKGSELFSNTYDANTTSAVIATLHWANKQLWELKLSNVPQTDSRYTKYRTLINKTRHYLRLNWTLYSLAAGKVPAKKVYTRFNHGDDPPFDRTDDQRCNGAAYNGPFMALAGMRSTPEHICGTDDRAPLLARALGWDHSGTTGTAAVKDILDEVDRFPRNYTEYAGENAYGLDEDFRALLLRHIRGVPRAGENIPAMMFNFLKNIRTAVPFHFVGARVNGVASQEARLTLMEGNMTQETTPVFAVTYDSTIHNPAQQSLARILFPWTNRPAPSGCNATLPGRPWRSVGTLGYARFELNADSPRFVFASSYIEGLEEPHCKNVIDGVPIQERFALPTNWQWYYHFKFLPDADPKQY